MILIRWKIERNIFFRIAGGSTMQREKTDFEPVFDKQSKILILGTFPSVKSRERHFYYGHPQNRFWKLMAKLLQCEVPVTIEEKKSMLLRNGVALWDVVESCEISGSSDSSIRDVIPVDLGWVLNGCDIRQIFANGNMAKRLYEKHHYGKYGRKIVGLPSTSPANAAYGFERLCECWSEILQYLF